MVLKTSLWQVGYMDEVVGNVTTQLKEKGMWDNVSAQTILPPFHIDRLSSLSPDAADRGCCRQTLVVSSSDNGGPIYAGGDLTVNGAAGGGANNFPLR